MCLEIIDRKNKKVSIAYKVVKIPTESGIYISEYNYGEYKIGETYKASNRYKGIYFFLSLRTARSYITIYQVFGPYSILKVSVKGLRETGHWDNKRNFPAGHADEITVIEEVN